MPKSEKQKQKLIRVLEILMRSTDSENGITVSDIISALSEYGISAERKSIYDDFLTLGEIGFEVEKLPTRPATYTLAERVFELAELKLLTDAVQSSKFITAERSRELIAKLKIFAGRGASALSRQVYVEGRAKTMNKSSIYSIDLIHTALNENRKISFQYFDYSSEKKRVLRRGAEKYIVSPSALIWSDEYYYLVGYDETVKERRHYRVDKMLGVALLDEPRSEEAVRSFDPADYTQKVFGMYGGEERLVTLLCDESLAGVIIDRFGTEHTFVKREGGFSVTLRVVPSPNFYAWVAGFGKRMQILAPKDIRDELVSSLRDTLLAYGEDI